MKKGPEIRKLLDVQSFDRQRCAILWPAANRAIESALTSTPTGAPKGASVDRADVVVLSALGGRPASGEMLARYATGSGGVPRRVRRPAIPPPSRRRCHIIVAPLVRGRINAG